MRSAKVMVNANDDSVITVRDHKAACGLRAYSQPATKPAVSYPNLDPIP